jgi:hypothetical protein
MDDTVRLVQLFAQVLRGRSRLGALRRLTWSRVEGRRWFWRLGERWAATRVAPTTNRQSRDPMIRMLLKRADMLSVPLARDCEAAKHWAVLCSDNPVRLLYCAAR